jgi:hypothetical protein
MKILFPCHELEGLKKVDDAYIEEYNSAKLQGFECFLFDHDKFVRGVLSTDLTPSSSGETLLLRSWMLKLSEYTDLYDMINEAYGFKLINTPAQYKNCHYAPESYKHIQDFSVTSTSTTNWTVENLQAISDFFQGEDFLMKDFVKSAKSNPRLFHIKGGISGKELEGIVNEFIEYRGNLFNEGLFFKHFVELKKDVKGNVNEWRLFFLNKRLISSWLNSNQVGPWVEAPDFFVKKLIEEVVDGIDSNFFTIDVIQKKDGDWFIVETGDGQVSGLSPKQNTLEFYNSIKEQYESVG